MLVVVNESTFNPDSGGCAPTLCAADETLFDYAEKPRRALCRVRVTVQRGGAAGGTESIVLSADDAEAFAKALLGVCAAVRLRERAEAKKKVGAR